MSGFSSDWLGLREPADHRARDATLIEALGLRRDGEPLEVVDLGAGTGSNLRYLLPRLGPRQRWRMIDNDPALIEAMPIAIARWARERGWQVSEQHDGLTLTGPAIVAEISLRPLDLAGDLEALALERADLLTASALLDLFSRGRLEALASAAAAAGVACLFVLSYDGRIVWTPEQPFDADVLGLLNAHQRRDKGLGAAAGPFAAAAMIASLEKHGYRVASAPTDWLLDAGDAALQRELIRGYREAAIEQQPAGRDAILSWHAAREALIEAPGQRLRVGHVDIAAVPSAGLS